MSNNMIKCRPFFIVLQGWVHSFFALHQPIKFKKLLVTLLLTTLFLSVSSDLPTTAQANLPPNFSDILIDNNIFAPTSLKFAPDGRLFVSSQDGHIWVFVNDVRQAQPFLTPADINNPHNIWEMGLVGFALDPNFSSNNYIYLFYMTNNVSGSPSPRIRISRITANGNVWQPGSEVILFEMVDEALAITHHGGGMGFGADGMLYIGVGDNRMPASGQQLTNLRAKVLRIAPDGSIPTDNPFYGSTTGQNQAIYAIGIRNPFTMDIHPTDGRILVGDVGADDWEELNVVVAGGNYGWSAWEGPGNPNPTHIEPVYSYLHGDLPGTPGVDDCAIMAGDFYLPATTMFPASYVGDFFISDHCENWIRIVDGNTYAVSNFATNIDTFSVDLEVSPDGALYYLSRNSQYNPTTNLGSLHRIEYTLPGNPPTITVNPFDTQVTEGSNATFNCQATGDAPISIQWQRNGVNIGGATGNSYTLNNAQHPADDGALFSCVATNPAGSATSTQATLTVIPSTPPVATINTPINNEFFSAGQTFTFDGTGTDAEDGVLPASAFEWSIVHHHGGHTHPFFPSIPGVTNGTFTIPTQTHQAIDIWYRVTLTVTDSDGLSDTTFVDVIPNTSTIVIDSVPQGLQFEWDSIPYTTPATIDDVEGAIVPAEALNPQTALGGAWQFIDWADGVPTNTRMITIPVSNTTYTANFQSLAGELSFSSATSNATEADATGGEITFTVSSGFFPSPITVDVAYGGSATNGGPTADYGAPATYALTNPGGFGPGTYTFEIITFVDDFLIEGFETIDMTLSNASNLVSIGQATHLMTVEDNDTATVDFVTDVDTIAEFDGTQTSTLRLITTTQNGTPGGGVLAPGITVNAEVTRTDVTTLDPDDFGGATNNGVFPPGSDDNTTVDIDTPIFDDGIAEGNEDFTLNLGFNPAITGVTLGVNPVKTITIVDDEVANILTTSKPQVEEAIPSPIGDFTVELTTDIPDIVSITITSPGGQLQLRVDGGTWANAVTLNFHPTAGAPVLPDTTWDVPQLVEYRAIDDTDIEGVHSAELLMTITSPTPNPYVDLSPLSAGQVVIVDNDVLQPEADLSVLDGIGILPKLNIFDPAISKIGLLLPGDLGIAGERLEWVTTVTNNGLVAGTNVVVMDTLRPELRIDTVDVPAGATFAISGQTVTVTFANIAPGQSFDFSIFTTVLESGVVVDNTVCVATDSDPVCTTALVPLVQQLPNTGERPLWMTLLLVAVEIVALSGVFVFLRRRGTI